MHRDPWSFSGNYLMRIEIRLFQMQNPTRSGAFRACPWLHFKMFCGRVSVLSDDGRRC
jgi:hypothetical protein